MTVDILDKAEGKGRLERIFTDELADIDVTEMDAKECEMESDDPLWRLPKGSSRKKKKKVISWLQNMAGDNVTVFVPFCQVFLNPFIPVCYTLYSPVPLLQTDPILQLWY